MQITCMPMQYTAVFVICPGRALWTGVKMQWICYNRFYSIHFLSSLCTSRAFNTRLSPFCTWILIKLSRFGVLYSICFIHTFYRHHSNARIPTKQPWFHLFFSFFHFVQQRFLHVWIHKNQEFMMVWQGVLLRLLCIWQSLRCVTHIDSLIIKFQ